MIPASFFWVVFNMRWHEFHSYHMEITPWFVRIHLPKVVQEAEYLYGQSTSVSRIDYFISHCWSDDRSGKVFALWIHSTCGEEKREREREKRCCLFMRKTNSYLCRITYIINIFVFFEQGHPEGSVASPARQFERSHVDFNSLGRYLHKFVSCTCLAGGGTAWFRFWILSVGVHPGIHHVFSDSGHVAKRSGTLSNHPLLFEQAPREIFRFLFLLNSCW